MEERIERSSELRKGMVLEFRHPTHPSVRKVFIKQVDNARFSTVMKISDPAFSQFRRRFQTGHYSDHSIGTADTPVPSWAQWTTWHVDDVSPETVDQMLADRCFRLG